VAAVTLVVAGVLAGCADAPRPGPSATSLPSGVDASLIQLRSDVAFRQAQVRVHNGNDEPVTITRLRVDDPRFARAALRALTHTTTIAPGATVDIRIELPPMECGDELELPSPVPSMSPGSATGPTATVHYALGESSAVAVAPLAEPAPFLEAMHARECRARALQDAATVTLSSFTPSSPGAPADLALTIAPTGQAAARIVGIQTTNLLTFDAGAGATADMYDIGVDVGVSPSDAEATVVHLPLIPLRCDAHAVQEDKRGTIFTLMVDVPGDDGGEIELAASEEMRGAILTWVGQWCGFGT